MSTGLRCGSGVPGLHYYRCTAVFDIGHFGDPGVSYADASPSRYFVCGGRGICSCCAVCRAREANAPRSLKHGTRARTKEQADECSGGNASIAHEVRQPLTGITTKPPRLCDGWNEFRPKWARVKGLLDEIEHAGFRASEVLTNVRGLFQDADHRQQPIDVNNMIIGSLQILNGELNDHGVKTDVELASELPLVMGNKVQLQEVISNLVNNSIDAMAPIKVERRTLKVSTKPEGAKAVIIELEDSGHGIEPERLGSIFEPFVTTKLNGTGLGLAICSTIIERHGGRIIASSDGKNGALFQIVLPVEPTVADTERREGNS